MIILLLKSQCVVMIYLIIKYGIYVYLIYNLRKNVSTFHVCYSKRKGHPNYWNALEKKYILKL